MTNLTWTRILSFVLVSVELWMDRFQHLFKIHKWERLAKLMNKQRQHSSCPLAFFDNSHSHNKWYQTEYGFFPTILEQSHLFTVGYHQFCIMS